VKSFIVKYFIISYAAAMPTIEQVKTYVGDPAWFVRGYELVKELLADPRLGRTHESPETASRLSESMIFGRPQPASPNEQADHTLMRKTLSRSFSARRLARLRPRVQELVDELLSELAAHGQPADFHDRVSFPLPALVISELLGVPPEDRENFRRWSDDAAHMDDEQRSMSGLASLWQYMLGLLERKRSEPAEDVLTDLLETYDAQGAAQLAAGLLFAGHETTVTAIDKGVVLLLDHAAQKQALEDHPDLVKPAVEEILRMPFPVATAARDGTGGLPRYANADLPVLDVVVPKGDLVLLDTHGANLEAEQFAEPERFDVARGSNPHLTFGHGPHFCIGAPLARIELQVLFGTLFTRIPTLRLAGPRKDLRVRSHLLTGGIVELPVAW
jgi:cytochrome P450